MRNWKKGSIRTISALSALIAAIAAATPSTADVPRRLTEQGRLFGVDGEPVTGTRSFVFAIYDVAEGGTALWIETQPEVPFDDGFFSVELGAITPIPASVF